MTTDYHERLQAKIAQLLAQIAERDKQSAKQLLAKLKGQIADFQEAGDQHTAEKFIDMRAIDYLKMIIAEEE